MATSLKSSGLEVNTGTGDSWSSMTNVRASDDADATSPLWTGSGGNNTRYMRCNTMGHAIPGGATIDGMEALIENAKTSSLASVTWRFVRVVIAGSIKATERSDSSSLASSDTVKTFGGPTDHWGETLTVSNVNAAGFGVAFSVDYSGSDPSATGQAYIDHVQTKVYYTTAGNVAGGGSGSFGMVTAPVGFASSATKMMKYVESRSKELWRPSRRKIFIPGLICAKRILEGVFPISVGGSVSLVKG